MIGLNSEVETAMKTIKGTLFLIKHQQKKKKKFLLICKWHTRAGAISGFCNILIEKNSAIKDEINMHLHKLSVAALDSSEKCGNLLTYFTVLQERITTLTPIFTWLFWIQLLDISITIAHLSHTFPTLFINPHFHIYLCPQATFQFTSKVIWRYHFYSLISAKLLHWLISVLQ